METAGKQTTMTPIGVVRTRAATVPRDCRVSDVEGHLDIKPYMEIQEEEGPYESQQRRPDAASGSDRR